MNRSEFLLTRPLRGATWSRSLTTLIKPFLLTRPLRGATCFSASLRSSRRFLLTRPLRGATLQEVAVVGAPEDFYSHAPCGARLNGKKSVAKSQEFLLTRPLRGATMLPSWLVLVLSNFYSHAPCGARQALKLSGVHVTAFLLTRPLRGATATYSIRNFRTSHIQEADSKIITKYAIKLNILHASDIKSRRTSSDYMNHSTFACYSP